MSRWVMLAAAVLILAGPIVVLLGAGVGVGALVFAGGLILLGIGSLIEGHDRPVAFVMIGTGMAVALFDLLRLLFLV